MEEKGSNPVSLRKIRMEIVSPAFAGELRFAAKWNNREWAGNPAGKQLSMYTSRLYIKRDSKQRE